MLKLHLAQQTIGHQTIFSFHFKLSCCRTENRKIIDLNDIGLYAGMIKLSRLDKGVLDSLQYFYTTFLLYIWNVNLTFKFDTKPSLPLALYCLLNCTRQF